MKMMTSVHYEALCALEDEASTALAPILAARQAVEAAQQAFEAVVEKYAQVLPPIIAASGDPTGMLQAELNLSETQDAEDWESMIVAGLREAIMHEDEARAA
jgi:hypothetical protein